MKIETRIYKLEQEEAAESIEQEACGRRWLEACMQIMGTMRDDHIETVHEALVGDTSIKVWEYIPSFLAARVHHLVTRAAQGFHAVLQMPPRLADVWLEYERDCMPLLEYPGQRFSMHHSTAECAECGAEYPRLRPMKWTPAVRDFNGPSKEYVKACLLCGGKVGFHAYSKRLAA